MARAMSADDVRYDIGDWLDIRKSSNRVSTLYVAIVLGAYNKPRTVTSHTQYLTANCWNH